MSDKRELTTPIAVQVDLHLLNISHHSNRFSVIVAHVVIRHVEGTCNTNTDQYWNKAKMRGKLSTCRDMKSHPADDSKFEFNEQDCWIDCLLAPDSLHTGYLSPGRLLEMET